MLLLLLQRSDGGYVPLLLRVCLVFFTIDVESALYAYLDI